jgi:hypothetical protein
MAKIKRRNQLILSNPSQTAYTHTPNSIRGVPGIAGSMTPKSPPNMVSKEIIKIII